MNPNKYLKVGGKGLRRTCLSVASWCGCVVAACQKFPERSSLPAPRPASACSGPFGPPSRAESVFALSAPVAFAPKLSKCDSKAALFLPQFPQLSRVEWSPSIGLGDARGFWAGNPECLEGWDAISRWQAQAAWSDSARLIYPPPGPPTSPILVQNQCNLILRPPRTLKNADNLQV